MNPLIVERKGYLKLEDVKLLDKFLIYKTHKNTHILVKNHRTVHNNVQLFYPKYDKLPYKILEGKKIVKAELVFDSAKNVNFDHFINNQIMAYNVYTS